MEVLSQIRFKDFDAWDVKQYLSSLIVSNQEIVKLSKYIKEEKNKVKPFENPKDDFKILGVNNKIGLFDNEIKKGSEINQPYKIVENGFLAFNPYRINVGSIGLKTNKQQNNLISPAYVVFSCKEELLPEYLFMIFKANTFNQIIKDNTKGSVRQILSFDILERLQIPLPPLEIQQKLVKNYQDKLNLAKQQTEQAQQKVAEIETYLYKQLGIELPKEEKQNTDILQFVRFKDLQEWGFDFATKIKSNVKSIYPVLKVSDICNIGSGGTPSRDNLEYYQGNISWVKTTEVRNNHILETSEKITNNAIKDKNLKLYPKGSLIMAMYGQGLTRGRISKLSIKATTNQACAVFHSFSNDINVDYLWFYLQNEYHRLRALASGNNQPNLNSQKIKNYPIVIPPLKIQNQIAEHIQNIKNEIQTLKRQAEQNPKDAMIEFEEEIFNAS